MSVCPECHQRVPFGGGKTAKNAHKMLAMAQELTEFWDRFEAIPGELTPEEKRVIQANRAFINSGRNLGRKLHEHAHKQLPEYMWPTPYEWQSAGQWIRDAVAGAHHMAAIAERGSTS
jgi:hypothetical protein